MKLSRFKLIPVLALSLLFAGCSTLGGSDEGEADATQGAPVAEAGDGEGAQTSGASEGGAWTGSALDNPDSPLYTKVIYFDYDISEIRADYLDTVVAHGEYLAANPSASITVEGHCDERGSREYNIGLGERRANAVKRLLLAQGAAESQIITISYGEERPEVLGSSESSWAQNRRAILAY
ncbi:MAG: peptidoglycan-associated lipoprotein Pal [Candidatus Sedimenticola sp. PURPLELP]